MSYLEWLKNIHHVSFGRVSAPAAMSIVPGRDAALFPRDPSHAPKSVELAYVRNTLAHTMAMAYQEIRAVWRSNNLPTLRTAAYVLAIDKVAENYEAAGIFP